MLINMRNGLMAGKRLPYDAEVEYLESTGTQWIDTGVTLSSQTDEVDAIFYSTNRANMIIFGSRISVDSQNFGCGWSAGSQLLVDVSNGNYLAYRAITQLSSPSGLYTIHASRQERIISGPANVANTTLADIFTTSYNCYLFNGSGNFWTTNKFVGRFYSFRIKRNGTLVRDFIPVRVGNVGYMYDRVSGQLFGNDGTGDFVLGPDVVPVEYIESHGTEWIDTGIAPTNHRTVVDFSAASLQSLGYIAGSFNTNNRRYYPCVLDRASGMVILDKDNNIVYSRTIDTNRHIVDYYDYQGRCLFDGVAVGSISATLAAPINNLAVFANRTASGIDAPSTARIYEVQVYERQNQEMVRSFLPVRVGTDATSWEGAMMDVLTRRIYRNAGTGAFAYGNDLKYPIPAE